MDQQVCLILFGAVLSLAGALVVFGLNQWAARAERQRELRSVLAAIAWELRDAEKMLGVAVGILGAPILSVDTLLARGLLVRLPTTVSAPLLKARSLIEIHNRMLARHLQNTALAGQARIDSLGDLTQQAHEAVPFVQNAVEAIEPYLGQHLIPR